MMDASDQELWSRTVEGDASAFETLFLRHANAIYNFCGRRLGDWSGAEDLTSTVFLEAWRRRTEVDIAGGTPLPWLYGIALNVTRNQRRSDRRRSTMLSRLPTLQITPDFSDDVASRIDDERRMREILSIVGLLTDNERDVLALCVWEGLSYEDAARAIGVPIGTIRSRLSRARARLNELAGGSGHVSVDSETVRRWSS